MGVLVVLFICWLVVWIWLVGCLFRFGYFDCLLVVFGCFGAWFIVVCWYEFGLFL